MTHAIRTTHRAGHQCSYHRILVALSFLLAACPVAMGTNGSSAVATMDIRAGTAKGAEATIAKTAFIEFLSILRGYPDLFFESDILWILQKESISREQFEKDVAAYVLPENEWGYVKREESDYDRAVQELKLLRRAMDGVAEKAQILHNSLILFAQKSVQTAQAYTSAEESELLTPEEAEKALGKFSLTMVRLFARDLVAFRSHAQWLDGDVQSESPNRAPRSIAVSQYLSCSGNNAEIIMGTGAARHLWNRQVALVEADLFTISDSWEEGHALCKDSIGSTEWTAPRDDAEKAIAALKKEWEGVKSAYTEYINAWELAFAPMPGYRGSGTPYWCADMCMHLFSHWEELVSSMLFRNQSESSEVNKACFMLRLPTKSADDFAAEYIKELSDAVKQLGMKSEEGESAVLHLQERVARLYDARMRCAIAGISCEFHGDGARISEEIEKTHKLIKTHMLQDITSMCNTSAANGVEDKQYEVYSSRNGAELWRNQMRLMLVEIGNSYEQPDNPEPFSGETNPAAASFSDVHVQRIRDLLEETDNAWNWYRRYWSNLLVCLSDIPQFDCEKKELRLHALREQWLRLLYSRANTQNCPEM